MTLTQLIEQCGDGVSFQLLSMCLSGNQKTTKHGTQITFIAPGIPLVDLVSAKPSQVGLVVWLPGKKFREIQDQISNEKSHDSDPS